MAGQRVAVVGVGQTKHRSSAQGRIDRGTRARSRARGSRRRGHGLVRHRGRCHRQGAGHVRGHRDARAVPRRRARAVGKPMMRVHTAGSVGGSTSIVAAKLVAVGRHDRVLDRRVREAIRVERDVGIVGADAVPAPAALRARAAISPRSSTRTCTAPGRRATSAISSLSRTGGPHCVTPRHTCISRTSASRRSRSRSCSGTRSATSTCARRRTARWRWCSEASRRRRRTEPAGLGARHGDAQRAHDVRRPRPGQSPGRS